MDNQSMTGNKPSRSSWVMVAVAVVLALVLGLLIGHMMGSNKMKNDDKSKSSSSMTPSTTTKAANLRVTLNNLLREHVTTNLAVTYNITSEAEETKLQASLDAQTANAVSIANAVGSVYGDNAKTALTAPFVEHLKQSNNYAKAVTQSDSAAQATALTALQKSLRDVANVFHSVIPSLSSDTLYGALNDHETIMNQIAEASKNNDFKKAYELENQALTQISGGADALAKGIVEAKPELFR